MTFAPPEPLASHHSLADFDCGIFALDDWLKRRAGNNQIDRATRTFRDFDLALGFDPSPLEPMTLTIALKDLRAL